MARRREAAVLEQTPILARLGVGHLARPDPLAVGGDAAGLWLELSRLLPAYGEALRQLNKKWVDSAVGEHGNYTARFAQQFSGAINQGGEPPIDVRLFHWSGENHHIGRADGAVRLFAELDQRQESGRRLLWGHSHAGNVFALLTNLLAADGETVDQFFEAAEIGFRDPLTGRVDLPLWEQVWQRLKSPDRRLDAALCDFVTFGTPIRYGGNSAGYGRLLHFVNHRPAEGLPDFVCRFPPTLDDVLHATGGDYIQQLGIAGTNVAPGLISWRSLVADRRLNRLLQGDMRMRDLHERLKLGMRVPAHGVTLLCDYGVPEEHVARHHAGHAVYTHSEWLLFHAEQTCAHLYGEGTEGAPQSQIG